MHLRAFIVGSRSKNVGFHAKWRFLAVFVQSVTLEIPMFCCYIDLAPGKNAIEK